MPVVALEPNHKISPWFVAPVSGKVRIYVETTLPIDVFVSSSQQASLATSIAAARAYGILCYEKVSFLDQTISLPSPAVWNAGWNLTIGHPGPIGAGVAAVYYAVFYL